MPTLPNTLPDHLISHFNRPRTSNSCSTFPNLSWHPSQWLRNIHLYSNSAHHLLTRSQQGLPPCLTSVKEMWNSNTGTKTYMHACKLSNQHTPPNNRIITKQLLPTIACKQVVQTSLFIRTRVDIESTQPANLVQKSLLNPHLREHPKRTWMLPH